MVVRMVMMVVERVVVVMLVVIMVERAVAVVRVYGERLILCCFKGIGSNQADKWTMVIVESLFWAEKMAFIFNHLDESNQ